MAQPLARWVVTRRVYAALRGAAPVLAPGPLIVSGLLNEAKGVSEGARLSLAAFRAAGFDPVAHDLRPLFDRGIGGGAELPARGQGGVWFVHVNAPEAVGALGRVAPRDWLGRYRIGYWAYELPRVPADWVKAARAFHEIWAPSHFTADALARSGVSTPVRVMPHPVALGPPAERPDRAAFDLPPEAFVVLAMGDLRSSAARKNLAGAIAIHLRAFPAPAPGGAYLVVKVREADAHPAFLAEARRMAAGRDDIRFLTDEASSSEVRRLIASCSVLLSPHRAEGFGLPLAEAFMAGVPALATDWSGNLEFMAGLEELLIPSRLAPVSDPYGVYRASGLLWAEPDIAAAALCLKSLAAAPALREQLAGRGRAAVEALSQNWSREALLGMPMARWIAATKVDAPEPSR